MKLLLNLAVLLVLVLGVVASSAPAALYAQNGTTPGGTPNGTTPGGTPNGTTPGGTPNGTTPGSGTTLQNPLKGIDSLPALLEAILAGVVRIGSIILTLALVYVGFLFVVAQGNEEKLKNARGALMWTVIGGLVLLGASAIGKVIEATANNLRT